MIIHLVLKRKNFSGESGIGVFLIGVFANAETQSEESISADFFPPTGELNALRSTGEVRKPRQHGEEN